jgi:hypothetical protein
LRGSRFQTRDGITGSGKYHNGDGNPDHHLPLLFPLNIRASDIHVENMFALGGPKRLPEDITENRLLTATFRRARSA